MAKTSLSNDRSEVPDWICGKLDLKHMKEVAQLVVTSDARMLYDILSKYFAERAVDIDVTAPKLRDRIHEDPFDDARQWPGKLSTWCTSPCSQQDDYRRGELWKERDKEGRPGSTSYMVGYGWGKICTDEDVPSIVIFEHYVRGDPLPYSDTITMCKVFTLYAKSDMVLKKLVREARAWFVKRESNAQAATHTYYTVYTLRINNTTPDWKWHGKKHARPLNTVILGPGLKEAIVGDARDFFDKTCRSWYIDHGVPYKRNFLFHGPPGGGKTSMISALAGELNLGACFITLSSAAMTDQILIEALRKLHKPCILIFEDIDALFHNRTANTRAMLTFSGLLNAVDGLVSAEGVLIIMTTNHKNRLDPALLRCGRVDRHFMFDLPGPAEIAQLFRSFYSHEDMAEEKMNVISLKFASKVMARPEPAARSLATLQQHFIYCRRDDAETAFGKLDEFFETNFHQVHSSLGFH